MWTRVCSQLKTVASSRSAGLGPRGLAGGDVCRRRTLASAASSSLHFTSPSASPFQKTVHLSAAEAGHVSLKNMVEDVMPIATGLEREELEAELEGRKRFDMDPPVGPFGTKEVPAVVQSYYDKRIVGCPGGEGEDEHDVVWFWLEKGKQHECPVCCQSFVLEVIGKGGPPEGYGDDDH